MAMNNSLAEVHPELVSEWSEKNLTLTPDDITFGSNKKVWWRGACGHEWQASVKARSNGEKCPICSGARVIAGINDLTTLEPLLVKQWSKKNRIKPTEVSIGSHKKVIWRCEKGHEWEAAVKSRTINKTGCPYCSHNKVLAGFNDLATLIIGDPDRLRAVAEDFIKHYETRVAEGATVAGKAMFVCSNRNIAYDFYKIVKELRPEWTEKKICDDGVVLSEKDKKELKPMEKIKLVMTRNKDDEKDLFDMLGTKEDRKEFDRQFKNPKSNFKIAIVVDMWLTGFDVPELDTIYIDKPIQQHTLIQTISRVNRVCEGKDKGLIVDYIGIKKNMNTALKKYTNFESEEFEGVEQSITIVKDQLEVLGQMFHNFNSSDFFNGSPTEQLACLNRAVEYVQLSEELERRFMAAVKRMKQAFNLCSSSEKFSDEDKDYIHFYCAVRSILFKLTKGDAPDIEQMNARVRKMLEGAIQSDGIEELFETGKHISVDIFSDEYMDKINAIQLPNTKIKILQRLLSQAIDEFKKVNKIMGVEFADRLKKVVDEYNNRRRDEAYANEVLDDVAEQLAQLLSELKTEKNSFKNMGIDYEEKAFYDILKAVSKKFEFEYPDDKMIELSKRIKLIVEDKSRYTDWSARDDIKANLQVDLILLLDEFGYPPVTIDDVYKEVLEQAENFKKYAQ